MDTFTFREKLRFVRNTAFCLIAAQGALLGYGEYQGYLDVRFYGTQEQVHQAHLHMAERIVACEAITCKEDSYDPKTGEYRKAGTPKPPRHEEQTAQAEPAYSVFDAPKHHHGK